jgi:tRNA C32,U32 (ribose-2'-O)-methylase TrmJ
MLGRRAFRAGALRCVVRPCARRIQQSLWRISGALQVLDAASFAAAISAAIAQCDFDWPA